MNEQRKEKDNQREKKLDELLKETNKRRWEKDKLSRQELLDELSKENIVKLLDI